MPDHIPNPIHDLIDFVLKEMKYNGKVFKDESTVRELTKEWVLASYCRGENVSNHDIFRTMNALASMPRDQLDLLKNMFQDMSRNMSLQDGNFTIQLIAKAFSEKFDSGLSQKLEKLDMVLLKNPKTLVKEEQKAEYKNELKNAFKEIIKIVDTQHKLSEEAQNKLADECAERFMAKPSMSTLREIITEIKQKVGLELKPVPTFSKDEKEEDTSAPAKLSLPPPNEIKVSEIPAYAASTMSLTALASIATKLDLSSIDPNLIQAHIAAHIEANFPTEGTVKAFCDAEGIGHEHKAPTLTPPGTQST